VRSNVAQDVLPTPTGKAHIQNHDVRQDSVEGLAAFLDGPGRVERELPVVSEQQLPDLQDSFLAHPDNA